MGDEINIQGEKSFTIFKFQSLLANRISFFV